MRRVEPPLAVATYPTAAALDVYPHPLSPAVHPPAEAIEAHLRRILESRIFARSARLSRFLEFVVQARLNGREGELKEYVIGADVYDRRPPYHPSMDSIVRSEAQRLRRKLKEYYQQDGASDPIRIYFKAGSYVPAFAQVSHEHGCRLPLHEAAENIIAVRTFVALTGTPLESACAKTATHELCQRLCAGRSCKVVHMETHAPLSADLAALGCLLVDGDVALSGGCLHINVRLVGANGFLLDALRYTQRASDLDALALSSEVATSIAMRMLQEEPPMRAHPGRGRGDMPFSRDVADDPAIAMFCSSTTMALAFDLARQMLRLRPRQFCSASRAAHSSSPIASKRGLMKLQYRPRRLR